MKAFDAAMTTIGVGTIGIFIAYIVWYLNEEKIWVDQMITTSTPINEVMAVIIVIFILVGVIMAAMRNR